MKKLSILFVCLGNICRSPIAEGLMRVRVGDAGIGMDVDSAGTGDWHLGKPPHPGSQALAVTHAFDISRYRARQVNGDDWFEFTHMIALDRSNMRDLEASRPAGATAELSMLLDHADGMNGDVLDPYGLGDDAFDQMFAQIDAGVGGLLLALRG